MSDNYLGDALLRGQDPIDFRALTDHVLRRDRRRVWLVGAACVVAWMLVVMIPWSTVMPMLAKVVEHQAALNKAPAPGTTPQQQQEQTLQMLQIVKQGTIATFVGSLASMFVAAVCTVSLVLLSRRATLRQVNARLADLSAELKAFKAAR
jgi:hypothetical protein